MNIIQRSNIYLSIFSFKKPEKNKMQPITTEKERKNTPTQAREAQQGENKAAVASCGNDFITISSLKYGPDKQLFSL